MKLSEIEGLRRCVEHQLEIGPDIPLETVARLLQEREMLLGFAREVADGCDCESHSDKAREAIRKAES